MDEAKYYNALAIALKGNYSKINKIWEKSGSWEKAWQNTKNAPDPDKELAKLDKLGVKIILKSNPAYPRLLKEIPLPPFAIYALGDLDYSEPAIAIVGTRNATPQGKSMAQSFATDLAGANLPIISGLALGIDAEAHAGAVESKGKTIAVLGTPLNHIYPRQNEKLADKILKTGGAIISEFPFGHPYNPANFLARNRIISGLSAGILIIEAPERSGSLATARFALEQNRDIFVVPGNINSNNYKGSHDLLKSGAILTTQAEDIFNHYNIEKSGRTAIGKSENPEEQEIIEAIRQSPITTEQLVAKTEKEISKLNQILALLTIKGIIKELNGKYFIK